MKNKLYRGIALTLSVLMLLSLCPLDALAVLFPSDGVGLPVNRDLHTYEFYNLESELIETRVIRQNATLRPPLGYNPEGFIGWYKEDGQRFDSFGIKYYVGNTQTIKLYARKGTLHTVVFLLKDSANNTAVLEERQVLTGTTINLPQAFIWKDGSGTVQESPLMITADTTLFADENPTYSSDRVRVLYTAGEGSGTAPVDEQMYVDGGKIILKAPGALAASVGKSFIGWKMKDDNGVLYQPGATFEISLNGERSIEFIAQWASNTAPETPTVTYHQHLILDVPGKSVSLPLNAAGNNQYTVHRIEETGLNLANAKFMGWSLYMNTGGVFQTNGQTSNTQATIDPHSENHLYATWERNYVSVIAMLEDAKGTKSFAGKKYTESYTYQHYNVPVGMSFTMTAEELRPALASYLTTYDISNEPGSITTVSSVSGANYASSNNIRVYLNKKPSFGFRVQHFLQKEDGRFDMRTPDKVETFETALDKKVTPEYLNTPGYEWECRDKDKDSNQIVVSADSTMVFYHRMKAVTGKKHWVGDNDENLMLGSEGYKTLNNARPTPRLELYEKMQYGGEKRIPSTFYWDKEKETNTWAYTVYVREFAKEVQVSFAGPRSGSGGGGSGSGGGMYKATYLIKEAACSGYKLINTTKNADGSTDFTNQKQATSLVVEKSMTGVNSDESQRVYLKAGDVLHYAVSITNKGNQLLRLMDGNDTLVPLEDWDEPTTPFDGELSPGETWTVTYSYEITEEDMLKNTVANEVTITAEDADGNEVTASDATTTDNGTLVVKKTDLTVQPKEASKTYDGAPLVPNEVVATGLPEGYTVEAVFGGSQTSAGEGKSEITSLIVRDAKGQDVTKDFNIKLNPGALKVGKRPLTLTSNSSTRIYDGTALTAHGVTVGGDGLVKGEELTYAFTGTRRDAGTSGNGFTFEATAGTSLANYEITKQVGVLTITPRTVILTSASANKVFDGAALTAAEVLVTGDGFVQGEGATYAVGGRQVAVGQSENEFTYRLSEKTQPGNYEIIKQLGLLQVLPNLTTYRVEYHYDGVLDAKATETLTGEVNDIIHTYPNKIAGGYKVDREENLPLTLTENAEQNVIRVYYAKKVRAELIIETQVPLAGNMAALNIGDCLE